MAIPATKVSFGRTRRLPCSAGEPDDLRPTIPFDLRKVKGELPRRRRRSRQGGTTQVGKSVT